MMRLDPSIRLNRMVVLKGGKSAWDEEFHLGLNIIRSDGNSGGKSSIADLIFYGLGGDFASWKDEAGSCDSVFCEVTLNGQVITLRRDIEPGLRQPMSLYFGSYEEARTSGPERWQRYPYTRAGARESFTQVLFRLLSMPEVQAEAEGNLTMHQLLRLIYVDQMTPVDRIFRLEKNDSPLRRQAVGDLALGLYDNRIYPAQIRLRELQNDYDVATSQLTALTTLLSRTENDVQPNAIEMTRVALTAQRAELLEAIAQLKRARFAPPEASSSERDLLADMQADLDRMNTDIADTKITIGQLTYQVADADELIADISRTLDHLSQADAVRASLGAVALDFCPNCLGPLRESTDPHLCRLCHSPTEPEEDRSRYARMRNELAIQLKESSKLQRARQEALRLAKDKAEKLTVMRDLLATEFLSISESYVSAADSQIDLLSTKVGYIDRQLIDLEHQAKIHAEIEALRARKNATNTAISNLKESIQIWERERGQRQGAAYEGVKRATATVLARDTLSEAEFTEDGDVYFNFAEDRISINGKSGFSASSLTIIRNAFHLALHWKSCTDSNFMYPRFTLMDNIEDKGMVPERSKNFQRIIKQVCDQITVDHQLIFTTSMIDESLDIPEYTVGEKYDFGRKSLNVGRPGVTVEIGSGEMDIPLPAELPSRVT